MALDLLQRTPKYIQNIPLWRDFLDAVTLELNRFKTEVAKKASYYDIDAYTDIEELKDFSTSFGYPPILNIAGDDLDYLKQDTKSLPFKIKNKGTLYYYHYIFNLIPYSGGVYSFLYDTAETTLFRAIDIPDTIIDLDLADFTEPFVKVASIVDGYTYGPTKYGIDAYIDYLDDQAVTVTRTKRLGIEYAIEEVLTVDSTEYLMTSNYLRYLERATDYGRKASTTPHVGAQLNLLIDETGFYDTHGLGEAYSVADLKLQSSTTDFFRTTPSVQINLDESEFLDSGLQWYLDNEDTPSSAKTDDEKYFSVVAGVGTKDLVKTSEVEHYPLTTGYLLYLPMDKDIGRDLEDLSANEYPCELQGAYTYAQGPINQCPVFNGVDTQIEISSYSVSDGPQSYSFWINGLHSDQTGNPRLYSQSSLLDIYYASASQEIYATLTGSAGGPLDLIGSITLDGSDHHIIVVIDTDMDTAYLYIDDTLEDDDSLIGLGTFDSSANAYIGSSGSANYWKGKIDDLRRYDFAYTEAQRTYLYEGKQGTLAFMSDQVFSQPLAATQRYNDAIWNIIQGWIPARLINGEIVGLGDGADQSFSGTFRFNPIKPNYVDITFIDTATTYHIVDDGLGLVGGLSGTGVTGTINYATGAYTLTFTSKTPDADTLLEAKYNTTSDLQITEVGIADDDGHLIAYATFPPIQFKDMFNHLAVDFCIRNA